MKLTDPELKRYGAKSCGKADRALLLEFLSFAENCETITPDEYDGILDGLSEYL